MAQFAGKKMSASNAIAHAIPKFTENKMLDRAQCWLKYWQWPSAIALFKHGHTHIHAHTVVIHFFDLFK